MSNFISRSCAAVLFLLLLIWPGCGLGADENLLGLYGKEEAQFLIRERNGELELLYKVKKKKKQDFASYCSYPLRKDAEKN